MLLANTDRLRIIPSLFFFSLSLLATVTAAQASDVKLVVLGVAQDAGYPQMNCFRPHCLPGWENPELQKRATSLGLVDVLGRKKYLFEATPDIKFQLYDLHKQAASEDYQLEGVFLTHGHMGHYAGLMHFGREAAGASKQPVYAMPRMRKFLSNNGPWDQLVRLKNIELKPLENQRSVNLGKNIKVTPFLVPHRDEYTETVGYKIQGPKKTAIFIPDIDKWDKWSVDIVELVGSVDYALLDATFYDDSELPGRDMSEIPHPFVIESMKKFSTLMNKNKVIFIHINHTNPVLNGQSSAYKKVLEAGFRIARRGMILDL